jgi:hypothetical protein
VCTEAVGRSMRSIDGRPAAEVLNEWSGGALDSKLLPTMHGSSSRGGGRGGGGGGGDAPSTPRASSIVRETALLPLAVTREGEERTRLVHPRSIDADGRAVQLFAAVPEGATVHALSMRPSDLASETAGVVRRAIADTDFVVRGAL